MSSISEMPNNDRMAAIIKAALGHVATTLGEMNEQIHDLVQYTSDRDGTLRTQIDKLAKLVECLSMKDLDSRAALSERNEKNQQHRVTENTRILYHVDRSIQSLQDQLTSVQQTLSDLPYTETQYLLCMVREQSLELDRMHESHERSLATLAKTVEAMSSNAQQAASPDKMQLTVGWVGEYSRLLIACGISGVVAGSVVATSNNEYKRKGLTDDGTDDRPRPSLATREQPSSLPLGSSYERISSGPLPGRKPRDGKKAMQPTDGDNTAIQSSGNSAAWTDTRKKEPPTKCVSAPPPRPISSPKPTKQVDSQALPSPTPSSGGAIDPRRTQNHPVGSNSQGSHREAFSTSKGTPEGSCSATVISQKSSDPISSHHLFASSRNATNELSSKLSTASPPAPKPAASSQAIRPIQGTLGLGETASTVEPSPVTGSSSHPSQQQSCIQTYTSTADPRSTLFGYTPATRVQVCDNNAWYCCQCRMLTVGKFINCQMCGHHRDAKCSPAVQKSAAT